MKHIKPGPHGPEVSSDHKPRHRGEPIFHLDASQTPPRKWPWEEADELALSALDELNRQARMIAEDFDHDLQPSVHRLARYREARQALMVVARPMTSLEVLS